MGVNLRLMDENDLKEVNEVHRDTFADLERRENLQNIGARLRVPDHFRMYLSNNERGNFVAELNGEIVGYCFTHQWGKTGWFGPLGVDPRYQRHRIGTELVLLAVDWLEKQDVTNLGLESIPQSLSNLVFYLKIGFKPLKLTLSLSRPVNCNNSSSNSFRNLNIFDYKQLPESERSLLTEECSVITNAISPGLDYLIEMERTTAFQFGTTLFFVNDAGVQGFAICHHQSYFQESAVPILHIRTMVFRSGVTLSIVNEALERINEHAAKMGCSYVQVGINTHHWIWLNHLISLDFIIDVANLRMVYPGYWENISEEEAIFSRWVG